MVLSLEIKKNPQILKSSKSAHVDKFSSLSCLTFHNKFHFSVYRSPIIFCCANVLPWITVRGIRDQQYIILSWWSYQFGAVRCTPGHTRLWMTIHWAVKRGVLVLSDSKWERICQHHWSSHGQARFTFSSRRTRKAYITLLKSKQWLELKKKTFNGTQSRHFGSLQLRSNYLKHWK